MDYHTATIIYMGFICVIIVALSAITLYLAAKSDYRDEQVNLNIEALDFFEDYIRRHPEASDEDIAVIRKKLFEP